MDSSDPSVFANDSTRQRDEKSSDSTIGGIREGSPVPVNDPSLSKIPTHIGRYCIKRLLGKGGFGLVYLARDEKLNRLVAVKVPHAHLVADADVADDYIAEACTVANLDHPNIAQVYDIGRTNEFPCYVVSKYVEGQDLSARLRVSRLSYVEAVQLVATIAEALHYAHLCGIVHRDIKPGNILIENGGKPVIADFGLALREQDVGRGPRHAGTPAYMSPEQARGEAHRVDGRSDIFSLGVVFYELLVGKRPFRGDSDVELLEHVKSFDPWPPRQHDDGIPIELERICLKALCKQASGRYSTAKDMADDLRQFLTEYLASGEKVISAPSINPVVQSVSMLGHQDTFKLPAHLSSSTQNVRIVPKGLRSFDENDADFFQQLLPGPRDRDGFPDSLRFWKTRIEELDSDKTFQAGLIYGPSGCGKSSLVKAGLLPCLSEDVISVYIESTPDETETRLLHRLRKRCPFLSDKLTLTETLVRLRQGNGIPAGKKVLLVLDQFEQWLHATKDQQNNELVNSLRQCDGSHVQCLVLVRDDFYVAVNRFFQKLEVAILEGHNYALVDLFDKDHARKVLIAFGQSYGRLPRAESEMTKEQRTFLEQAVEGLSHDGKCVSVRIALFAEMMKSRNWTPEDLRNVGGTGGLGITFLEDSFSASTSPPTHRLHQNAARAILKALLPAAHMDIKGQMQPYAKLLEVSGYTQRPDDFRRTLSILEREVRLISPAEPDEDFSIKDASGVTAGAKHYQLMHDFLVPSIREWLSCKERETRSGRAGIRLADRARLWNARREKNQLPDLWEYISIRCFTQPSRWTSAEKDLMKAANRYFLSRCFATIVILGIAIVTGIEMRGRVIADNLVATLLRAESRDVPGILRDIEPYRRWVVPRLREMKEGDEQDRLYRELALLHFGEPTFDLQRLLDLLTRADPGQSKVVAVEVHRSLRNAGSTLWEQMQRADTPRELLSIATVIAACDPDNEQWEASAREISEQLVFLPPNDAAAWIENLTPVGHHLTQRLREIFTKSAHDDADINQRIYVAALGLSTYCRHDLADLANLLVGYARYAPELHCLLARLIESKTTALAELQKLDVEMLQGHTSNDAPPEEGTARGRLPLVDRMGNAAIAELILGDPAKLREGLKIGPDQTLRSSLIHRIALLEVPPVSLISLLESETLAEVQAALLLSLGEYPRQAVPSKLVNKIEEQLGRFWNDADGELHSAARWLITRWDLKFNVPNNHPTELGNRNWFTSKTGHELAIVRGCLDYDFALSMTEVTVAEYRRFYREFDKQFREEIGQFLDQHRIDDCPAIEVNCFDAMRFCNWFSELDGLDPSQFCYELLPDGGIRPKPNHLVLKGYRLPDFLEWRHGCMARSKVDFSFGKRIQELPNYAWFYSNSRTEGQHRARAVGLLKPNAFGLFDMYGNVWEWTTNQEHPQVPLYCGGSCDNEATDLLHLERQNELPPEMRQIRVGFRLAKTLGRQP